ncbi:MAG: TRAP transporter large permease [Lachnospiraceae bacterium]|nr:TRAP transporter large permease [Lachnospiraceae bacterium]
MITAMIIVFLVLILIGVPIAWGTGLATLLYIQSTDSIPIMLLAQRMFKASDSFSLLAIPLFMLAGEFMNGGGITKRIVELASKWVGHITGSLGHVTVLASMLFASMSGSSAASAASIGGMLIPTMKEKGYDGGYAVAVTACSSVLGPIIPPSIAFVVYASLTGDSISQLFLGGIVPGILMGLCLMVLCYVIAKKNGYPVEKKATWGERFQALKHSIFALLMPIIILGGIMTGIFTATEAGCVGVVYGIIVGFATKELKISKVPGILLSAAKTTSAIMMIMGTSQVLGWILVSAQVPQKLTNVFLGVSDNPTVIFLLILLLILFLGCFMVDAAIAPIMVPLLLPIVKAYGINLLQFGIVFNMMTVAGGVTPPVGNLLYISSSIADVPIMKAAKATAPFLGALIVAMLLCVFFQPLVTFIPTLLGG